MLLEEFKELVESLPVQTVDDRTFVKHLTPLCGNPEHAITFRFEVWEDGATCNDIPTEQYRLDQAFSEYNACSRCQPR